MRAAGRRSSFGIGRNVGLDIHVGDVVTFKKPHPCGSKEWEVLRIGADFRLQCKGCGHQMMIARAKAEKNIKSVQSPCN
ncbi:MAG: DUF951 domain-containing protein [Lachnospiraceae bacterium]|nr:DUF951 domain-containing protein [Lachnospiraceae bacterium]